MNPNRIFSDVRTKILATGSEKTADTYESGLRLFCGYFYKVEHPIHVSKKQIVEFLCWVRQFKSDSMARTCYWAVRFLYTEIEGQPNKFDGIKPIRIKAKPKVPLTKEYIIERIKGIENPRDKAILWVLFSTGIRREEVAMLEQSNLLWNNNLIFLIGKGNKSRYVPFHENVQEVVRRHLELQKPSKFVFAGEKAGHYISPDTVYKKVQEYLGVSTHIIRYSFGNDLRKAGVDLISIKNLYGHSHLSTTEIYLKDDVERIKFLYNPMKDVA